ncbi:M20 family metallopeptidase [Synechococcus sp. PCC 7336]|uniref:M20 metallopeptidase family protein n=1 Tax=Synechococcus sp. PCC 7336 TaxID=195250 RepID=UPI00034652E2|nr:M20 family metallopeptidase [Synechococcus sp. PCC 7336]
MLDTLILNSPAARLREAVSLLQPELVAWRRHLHQYPEVGFNERKTAAFVADRLQEWGIEHQTEVAQTGVVAIVRGKHPGPTLGLRADMDALPIQEVNEIPYRSRHDRVMHACGHDGHTAIALGTAQLLQQRRSQLHGTVKFIFQPAEERPGGAKPMIEAGVLHNPDVDAMLGLHLWNNLPLGRVGVKAGPSMATSDAFRILILGKGGHGAIPHQTVDAIAIGAQVVTALHTIVSRNVNPLDSAVLSIGKFAAGETFNVIAAQAELLGTVRCFTPELADLMPQRIEQVVAGICDAHAATYDFHYDRRYPAVNNDTAIAQLVQDSALAVLGDAARVVPETTMGGEDMSFFLNEVPGCYFFLGSANAAAGLNYPHHHPRFDFDETALGIGVEIFLTCIERYTQSDLR